MMTDPLHRKRSASQVFETLIGEDQRPWLAQLSFGQYALLLALAFAALVWLLFAWNGSGQLP